MLGFTGCSEPEPVTIDIDDAAKNAGLTPDDYEVSDNGSIKIKAPESVKAEESATVASDQPIATQGKDWQYVVNNGIRTADEYSVKNNPAATFISNDVQANLVKQYGGKYEGEYLLTVINDNEGSVSYAQLRPLFDINETSSELDDEGQLWEVTVAKFNGQEF